MIRFGNATNVERPLIIAPVSGASIPDILTMVRLANESAADVVEWRVDGFDDLSQLDNDGIHRVLRSSQRPVLFTWRTAEEGGVTSFNSELYATLLEQAITAGVAGIDIEYRLWPAMVPVITLAKRQGVTVVVSLHDFEQVPQALSGLAAQMLATTADIVKIAVTPQSDGDTENLLALADQDPRLVVIGMGAFGRRTRLNTRTASFGALQMANAPGQFSVDELAKAFQQE
jgi:3-dehydroquinate dehydratase-1